MCEKCRERAKNSNGQASAEVKRFSEKVQTLLQQDAKERHAIGKAPHPFTHAESLAQEAILLVAMPSEPRNSEEEAALEGMFTKATQFKESILSALAFAGTVNQTPTIAGVIGMLAAAQELLEGFHPEVEETFKQQHTKDSATLPDLDIDDLLKGFKGAHH